MAGDAAAEPGSGGSRGAAVAAAGVPREGDLVGGKYRVESVLGTGGMGVVLAGRHEGLGQEVAIKFLLPEAARVDEAVARFLREARTAAALKSEHVVRVIDVGSHESGAPYMVMERLVGSDLGDELAARGPLPVAEAVAYVVQACEAMAEAHALGIVHRDLKPSNLFLTRRPNGTPLIKILDFGISKVEGSAASGMAQGKLTSTGVVMGSPVYMSPEQVRSSKNVDARTDIWSLGVILHELVSGRYPFEAESVSGIMAAIAADPPVPLREHRPEAPAELEEVVLRCLEKSPARRLPDVGALVAALVAVPAAGPSSSSVVRPPNSAAAAAHGGDATLLQTDPSAGAPALSAHAPAADSSIATQGAWSGGTARGRRRTAAGVVGAVVVVAAGVLGLAKSGLLGRAPSAPPAPSAAVTATNASPAPAASTAEIVVSPAAPAPQASGTTSADAPAASASPSPVPPASEHPSKRPPAPPRPIAATPAPAPAAPTAPKVRDPLSDR